MSVRGSVGGSGHPGTLRAVVLYIVLHAFRMPLLYSGTVLLLDPVKRKGAKAGEIGGVRGNRILSQMAEQMQSCVDCIVESF